MTEADEDGTVFFSEPLFRENLRYKVVPKGGRAAVLADIVNFIMRRYLGCSGIIYCHSRKVRPLSSCRLNLMRTQDAEEVAKYIQSRSGGNIVTGVYHSRKSVIEKELLRHEWHAGNVNVVCATTGGNGSRVWFVKG